LNSYINFHFSKFGLEHHWESYSIHLNKSIFKETKFLLEKDRMLLQLTL